jgi:hypothetical protein
MTGIPFDAIRSAALAIAPSLLADWFPRGRTFGREFKIGSIRGEAGESLSINLNTGVWKDFASNESGADLIDLRAAMIHSGDIGAAARELARILGVSVNGADRYAGKPPSPRQAKARGDDWQPMVPPPDGTAPPPQTALSDFDAYFEYTDANDSVTHYVGRIEARNGRPKLFIPLTYGILDGTQGWHKRKPGDPLPLYGLNRLAAFPDAEVILCEGEKAADAAQALFPDRPCLSWFGGTGSVGYADLAPLQGRRVIIWPDADEAGRKAAAKLATKISSARTLRVDNLPDKFDAADLIVDDPEAWLADRLPPPPKPDDALGIWDAGDDDYIIPPRGWLLGNIFCRRFLSSLVADGGVGKTALRVAQLLSLAAGRSLTGEHVFLRCKVLIVSLEDDADELRRRVYAAIRHYGLTAADVKGYLFLAAPKGLRLAEMKDGTPAAGALKTLLEQAIGHRAIDVISIDPFIKSHGLDENSNNAIDFVCTMAAKMAIDHDCAIDLPHHTNKQVSRGPGDADRSRGASSMKDAARLVYTLNPMTTQEALQFGLTEADRRSLIRMDSGKVNIAPLSHEATWFRIVGVALDNGQGIYPAGDNVQTVEQWHPPKTWEGLDSALLNRILDDIDAGCPDGSRYSSANAAKDRAAWKVVIRHAEDKNQIQAKNIIKAWISSGTLFNETYEDKTARKAAEGLRVCATKRPS